MKKILLFAVLVLAFSATAYGQAPKLDFRASGYIDFRTEWYRWNWNTNFSQSNRGNIIQVVNNENRPNGGEWNKTSAYVDSRLRLKFDAIMGKELSGTIFFEGDSSTWGDYAGQAGLNAPARNSYGVWGGDNASLEVKNVYFDVAVPYIPVPTTVRFGLQPFGIRSNMFMYADGAGVTVSSKIDPVQITAYWAKMLEGR